MGLLPRTASRGNRTTKASTAASELLNTFITEEFETPTQAPAASVYRAYQRACFEQNLDPLSSRAFYQRLKQRPQNEQSEKRKGSKAAYRTQPWYWELTYSTPRHGDRPLGIVHIDHTQLDIELRSATTGRLLGRPWLTLMVDAYSRRILAIYLTFDPPSYRSCMMAIRIDGGETLTLERLMEHALSLSQCERMALDAIEGEQKLGYSESRRDHLWRLLQSGMTSTTAPEPVGSTTVAVEDVPPPAKKPRKSGCNRAEVSSACVAPSKRSANSATESVAASVETVVEPAPPKKRRSKKTVTEPDPVRETVNVTNYLAFEPLETEMPLPVSEPAKKKTSRRVGQRNPQRDPVG